MNRNQNTALINLTSEEKKQLLEEIKYYFETERDEKLGIIASEGILDFFMETLGKQIYNKALEDAKYWYSKRMEDVEADFYTLYKPVSYYN
ncbi:MAG: hypothetical protein K0R00_3625 [Herbinix sp.]|nr:hypothetical protein [Herbinix sp.]